MPASLSKQESKNHQEAVADPVSSFFPLGRPAELDCNCCSSAIVPNGPLSFDEADTVQSSSTRFQSLRQKDLDPMKAVQDQTHCSLGGPDHVGMPHESGARMIVISD
ncbi:uncharacterized protein UTRI_03428 [Ustilago trichophora]|uniref:Uncharacterized protein n=1 Tax=Ustilago trichophora TaxID=86804 RepID=A0A5C3E266_9BASI|nr:uncharacterized protein UTRI_03428 [Ustilago trichophora]